MMQSRWIGLKKNPSNHTIFTFSNLTEKNRKGGFYVYTTIGYFI